MVRANIGTPLNYLRKSLMEHSESNLLKHRHQSGRARIAPTSAATENLYDRERETRKFTARYLSCTPPGNGSARGGPTRRSHSSGAGDTVIAFYIMAIAADASWRETAIVSNHAAGNVAGKVGAAMINPDEWPARLRAQVGRPGNSGRTGRPG